MDRAEHQRTSAGVAFVQNMGLEHRAVAASLVARAYAVVDRGLGYLLTHPGTGPAAARL